MKLQQLRYLLAIADNHLSVTTAARCLGTSQPGVSKQIINLELELGQSLFERRGKRYCRITPAGEQVIARARVIMQHVQGLRALAHRPAGGEAGVARCPQTGETNAPGTLPVPVDPKPPLRSRPGRPMIAPGQWATGAVVFLALLLAGGPVKAQTPAGDPDESDTIAQCQEPNSRQFDFWIGEWEVRGPEGRLLGYNSIERIPDSCALLESWQGTGGSRGMSINVWDADRARWTQRWVGAGATLWLEGGFEAGEMVLSGTIPRGTANGQVLDRITWTPLPDGRLRQRWEISADGGATWTDGFVGLYSAAERGAGTADGGSVDECPGELRESAAVSRRYEDR